MSDDQFAKIYGLIESMRQEMATKEDLAGVKEELTGVKGDLAGVKEDLAGVKEELGIVKVDVGYLKMRVDKNEASIAELRDEMRQGFDRVNNILDEQTKMLDTDETERLALTSQVNRQEDWIVRAAKTTGVRYAGS